MFFVLLIKTVCTEGAVGELEGKADSYLQLSLSSLDQHIAIKFIMLKTKISSGLGPVKLRHSTMAKQMEGI